MSPSSPEWTSIGVFGAISCDPSTSCQLHLKQHLVNTDAGAADDGDYELEEPERSAAAAGTPRRRSATSFRAISPAASRKHTSRKPKSPAFPSSSPASYCECAQDNCSGL
jgi:hypothetical protein